MTKKNKRRQLKGVPSLMHLLAYRRAHNSVGEKQYIQDHLMPLKPEIITSSGGEVMAFIVRIGKSPIMFTSHTDTVHMNSDKVWQKVLYDDKEDRYFKDDNQPLGADDASGNWLMFNMIAAGVPGVYAFFRGEERGGIGSSYCAKHRSDLFLGIEAAIAFDRRGFDSVITHQGAGRGCSDEFANSLVNVIDMRYRLDNTGVYTDTAEFFHLVPNCTNVSVGYLSEHSKRETQAKGFIEWLRDRLIAADWSKLDFTPPKIDSRFDDTKNSFVGWGGVNRFDLDDMYSQQGPWNPQTLEDEDDALGEVTPLMVADFLFEHCECLPEDLRNEALALSQSIYQSFE